MRKDFALMRLKNLQHFLNLCDNVQFNAVWDRRTIATQISELG